MMMHRHAVRAGSVRALGLLLLVLNGCGAQQGRMACSAHPAARETSKRGKERICNSVKTPRCSQPVA